MFFWFCFVDIASCASNPCNNDGACVEDAGGYRCVCSPGFTGPNCEIDEDECVSSPCAKGSTCVDKVWEIPGSSYPGAMVSYAVFNRVWSAQGGQKLLRNNLQKKMILSSRQWDLCCFTIVSWLRSCRVPSKSKSKLKFAPSGPSGRILSQVERSIMRAKYLAQEHTAISPARARTRLTSILSKAAAAYTTYSN